jgi:hypothetical protein
MTLKPRSHRGGAFAGSNFGSRRSFVEEVFPEMPRYFFHVRRGRVTVLDQEGVELADIEEAAKEALRRGREIAAKNAAQGIDAPNGAIVVANEHWSPMFEVPIEG